MTIAHGDVLGVLNRTLHDVVVSSVEMTNDTNRDELPVIYITARYRAQGGAPHVDDVLRASEALVDLMSEGTGYPILRLISDDDAPAMAAE